MSDNVIDMAIRRQRAPDEDRATARAAAEAGRLEAARDIAARLRSTPRTDMNDRAIFATNLAMMCGEALIDAKSSLRQIFETAFGKGFDAKYKKRKRFVCARDDDPPSEGFAALGADFVDLAEATAKVAHAGQPEDAIVQAKHRAILQLVEGSSLDDKRPPEARLKDEAVATLLECFDQMVRKVVAEVDLNAMRAVIEHDAVSAIINGAGHVEKLVSTETHQDLFPYRREGEREESHKARQTERWMSRKHPAERGLWDLLGDNPSRQMTDEDRKIVEAARHIALRGPNDEPVRVFGGDLDDPRDPVFSATDTSTPFAPRVVLGEIHSPGEIEGAVMLDIDEAEIEETLVEQERDYDAVVARHRLVDLAPAFDRSLAHRHLLKNAALKALALRFGYSEAWISEECRSFYDLQEKIADDGFEPPENPWTEVDGLGVVARRQIELKLFRDHATEHWHLCFALSQGVRFGVLGREGVYGIKRFGKPFEPSICLGFYDMGLSPTQEMVTCYLHKIGENRFMLSAVADEDWPKGDVLGIGMGWLSIPSEESLDALFTPIESNSIGDHRIEAPLDRDWNKPAPAKPGTLAGMILRNLAYAPERERYDLMLLEDARRKAEMARKIREERKAEFEIAINRLKD